MAIKIAGSTIIDDSRNIVAGAAATFSGTLDANGILDVDGHSELDNVNISGVSTFGDNVNLTANKYLYLGSTNQFVYGDGSGNVQFRTNSVVAYMEGSSAARIQGGSGGLMGVRVRGAVGCAELFYNQNL